MFKNFTNFLVYGVLRDGKFIDLGEIVLMEPSCRKLHY